MCRSSEVKIIFSCPWLEGFTITRNYIFAPVPLSSGLIKCQTLTHHFPAPIPLIPNCWHLLWLRVGGVPFTVCCFLAVVKRMGSASLNALLWVLAHTSLVSWQYQNYSTPCSLWHLPQHSTRGLRDVVTLTTDIHLVPQFSVAVPGVEIGAEPQPRD